MYIYMQFKYVFRAPFEPCAEAALDWTHFIHLHRKSHKEFRLLFKSGRREIFLYKTRFHPLPFGKTFIAFREYIPEKSGYRQTYMDAGNGRTHYQDNESVKDGENVVNTSNYYLQVSCFWKFFPKLFLWLFKRRMRAVVEEDNAWLRERIRQGIFTHAQCAPPAPETFDQLDDFMKNGFPKPEISLVKGNDFFWDLTGAAT